MFEVSDGMWIVVIIIFGITFIIKKNLYENPLVFRIKREVLLSKSLMFIDDLKLEKNLSNKLKEKIDYLITGRKVNFFNKKLAIEIAENIELTLIDAIAFRKVYEHVNTLHRKKKQMTHTDDYGITHDDAWLKELSYFVKVVLLPLDQDLPHFLRSKSNYFDMLNNPHKNNIISWWSDKIQNYLEQSDLDTNSCKDLDLMNGYEYEHYVSDIVEKSGWTISVTQASNDHGADVLAEKDGVRLVIQCKLYNSAKVGNKAVQEVFSAKSFYECDFAWVVSNAEYTIAATRLAESTKVKLLHHDEIPINLERILNH